MVFRIVEQHSVSAMEAEIRAGLKQLDMEERDCAAILRVLASGESKKFQTLFQTFPISVEAALGSRAL